MTTPSVHPGGAAAEVAGHLQQARIGPLSATVSFPADPVHLPVARSLAASLGAAIDFDLDTIADLRMAVDEMTSILIGRAAPGSDIALSLSARNDRVEVSGKAVSAEDSPIDQTTFGWAVLTALVRDLWTVAEPAGDGETSLLVKLAVEADRGGS